MNKFSICCFTLLFAVWETVLISKPRLKLLHRQDLISLFNWQIFLMKRALHFATKLLN